MGDLNLSMTRGKTGVFFLSVYQADGTTPQDLTGSELWFHAALSGLSFTIDKNSGASGGIVVTVPGGGADCATLTIDDADTDALPDGTFQMPCELVDEAVSTNNYLLNSGTITVYQNVGTP